MDRFLSTINKQQGRRNSPARLALGLAWFLKSGQFCHIFSRMYEMKQFYNFFTKSMPFFPSNLLYGGRRHLMSPGMNATLGCFQHLASTFITFLLKSTFLGYGIRAMISFRNTHYRIFVNRFSWPKGAYFKCACIPFNIRLLLMYVKEAGFQSHICKLLLAFAQFSISLYDFICSTFPYKMQSGFLIYMLFN